MKPIYLDFNASTPIAPEIVEAMKPYLDRHFGNPSSAHWAGPPAREAVETARTEVAALLNARPEEIIFTSGGSEANNHAIKGIYFQSERRRPHIITLTIEHPAVLEPCAFLERLGARVTRLRVDGHGRVDPGEVRHAITPDTALITVMHANNEVGTIEPVAEIGRMARDHGIPFHTDAAQSVGKIAVNVEALGVDLLTIAGHKLYAPKGVGALYIRSGLRLEPLIHGAGHERGQRAGTENVLFAVALGAACRLARLHPCSARLHALSSFFLRELQAAFGERIVLNGHPVDRLPNTLNVAFPGLIGQEILSRMPEVAASTGSACHAGSHSLSPVLAAMGMEPRTGLGAIRFSLGRPTTEEELSRAVDLLKRTVP